MVLVVDEYGEVQGLVTLQDVLEAVTGEFQPRNQEDAWAVQREDGSWLLDGLIPVPELKDRLELKTVPEEDKGRYHTLSGLMMWLLGRLPQTGRCGDLGGLAAGGGRPRRQTRRQGAGKPLAGIAGAHAACCRGRRPAVRYGGRTSR